MSEYISCVGKSRYNGISFDMYINKNGTATIRPNKNGTDFPRSRWIQFDNETAMRDHIEAVCGGAEGAARVLRMTEWHINDKAQDE